MKALITLVVALALATAASASQQERAAILEFDLAQGVSGIDRIYFSDRARTALHDSVSELFVMTRESTEALLQANGKTMADCTGECEVEIGRKLGADYIVSGRITRIGSRIAITMRLFATKDGGLLSSAEARGKDVDELQDRLDSSLAKLYAPLGVSASAASIEVEARDKTAAVTLPTSLPEPIQISGTVDVVVRSTLGEDLGGSSITVDGHPAGTAPVSLELARGEHFIQTMKDLYVPGKVRLLVKENEIHKVVFDLKPDFATVNITSDPDGTAITIDGVSAGRAPLMALRIKSGQHRVVAEHAEYVSTNMPLVAKPGDHIDVPVKLAPDFAPLTIESTPSGAEAFIDGKSFGRTPLKLERVKLGQHLLEIKGEPISFLPWRRTIEVKRDSGKEPVEASLSRREADVLITSEPPGATVWLDGTEQGQTSLKLRLLGGDHELRTTLTGYAPKKQVIHVVPPEQMRVKVQLSRGGSGPGHRFTLADLELQYMPEPGTPDFLPTSKSVQERAVNGSDIVAGCIVYGGLSGLVGAGFAIAATCSMPNDAGSCQDSGNVPLSIGVGIGTALVTSAIYAGYRYWSAPLKTHDVPDPDAIAINSERERAWNARKSDVGVYNRSIDDKLRAANAAFGADRADQASATVSSVGNSTPARSTHARPPSSPASGTTDGGLRSLAHKSARHSKRSIGSSNEYSDEGWRSISKQDRRHNAATLTWDEVDALPTSEMLPEELARWSKLYGDREHLIGKN